MSSEVSSKVSLIQSFNLVRACDLLPEHQLRVEDDGDYWSPSSPPSRLVGRNEIVASLMEACGLLTSVEVVEPHPATFDECCRFHDEDYLKAVLDWQDLTPSELKLYNLVDDSNPFPHVAKHAMWIAGASLCAAAQLSCSSDVSINWTGGRHHAHRSRASGFCFINDIVLAVLKLQKTFERIMVVDIDVHHGDGTEAAFAFSDKVFTMSFHQYEPGFFPGSGSPSATGKGKGSGYNLNVPFIYGDDGKKFVQEFKQTIEREVARFDPQVIVFVCGCDALRCDPRGGLRLKVDDLVECASILRSLKRKLLVLGGGGYNFPETAVCWTRITALFCGTDVPCDIPEHDFYELYGPRCWKLTDL